MKPSPSEGAKPETHPAPETINAFRQGKLKGEEAAGIARHLQSCPSYRLALKLPDDSFSDQALSTRRTITPIVPASGDKEAETITAAGGQGERAGASDLDRSAQRAGEADLDQSAMPMIDELAGLPAELAHHARLRIIRELGRGGMGAATWRNIGSWSDTLR